MDLVDELHAVRQALPLPGGLLLLNFEDRSLRVVDLSRIAAMGGALARLADREYVDQVRVDNVAGTVVWPDDVDLDPDVLYQRSTPVRGDLLRDWVWQARES
jgi:hypothetical protein